MRWKDQIINTGAGPLNDISELALPFRKIELCLGFRLSGSPILRFKSSQGRQLGQNPIPAFLPLLLHI